jgi:hypothetical protein
LKACATVIRAEVQQQPDVTLAELCERVATQMAVTASRSMMGRELQRAAFAVWINTELVGLLPRLKFLDEFGVNLGLTRLYGRVSGWSRPRSARRDPTIP